MAQLEMVTAKNFAAAMRDLCSHHRWVGDTETNGLYTWKGSRMCGASFTRNQPNAPAFYFPFRHEPGGNLDKSHLRILIRALNTRGLLVTGWNWKFDIHMLMADGMDMPEWAEDVMLACHLCDENERNYKLKDQGAKYFGSQAKKEELELGERLAALGYGKGDMWRLHPTEVTPYAAKDVVLTRRLRSVFVKKLKYWDLYHMWMEVNEYMLATVKMEQRGLKLDVPLIEEYIKEADLETKKHLKKLHKAAGYPINPASSKQMQAFLGVKSTAKDVLEDIPNPGPEVKLTLEYRAWAKVNNTYYHPYLEKMDSENVLHPNINQIGTISGRMSCYDPNLQAIAKWSHIYKVKEVLIARPGYTLVSADYSQAELRLGAHICLEKAMALILMSGRNIHRDAAEQMGIDYDAAKRINFSAFYGIGPGTLSRRRKIPFKQAESELSKYHQIFRRIKIAYSNFQAAARNNGHIRMWTGRVRRYTMAYPQYHKALSNKVQGGVAEIMRVAILRLYRLHKRTELMADVHMLLQVHDQIIFEVPTEKLFQVMPVIRATMEDFPQFKVPLKVDIKYGQRLEPLTTWETKDAK